ncbi:MAG: histidine--tRNA ligase [Bacillota bacterium]|nr:histidine--tRNA ligase [Bacillota bacterium]
MIRKPRGTNDILPENIKEWLFVENEFRKICSEYNFGEIRTPMFEKTSLFKRGVGDTTDIVKKEMYNVLSDDALYKYKNDKFKSSDSFTLKPEGTAPIVRAFVENKLYAEKQPTKLFYITPCFRHERPQAGRLRQFHQFGIETFSATSATADAEIISLADVFFRRLGIDNLTLKINSVGCSKCREVYHKELKKFLEPKLDDLCVTCNERYITNPLRILDCKNEKCQNTIAEAPLITDYLCDECSAHFEELKSALDIVEVDYIVDPKIVRGLDYYTKTAFEFISTDLGSQATVCGGGRYNGLVKQVDGPETPGVGFGLGIERLLMVLKARKFKFNDEKTLDVFIVTFDKETKMKGMEFVTKLRKKGVAADIDHLERSFKAQFRYSDALNSKYTIILGSDEIENNKISLKNMKTGEQIEMQMDNIEKIIELVRESK